MKVLQDIMPQLVNLTFQDSDTSRINELEMNNYMKLVRDSPKFPNRFVPMQCASGLERSGLLSLLFMPHFGWTREVDTYVKKLLLVFHVGFPWLVKPHSIDVDPISAITGFPRA